MASGKVEVQVTYNQRSKANDTPGCASKSLHSRMGKSTIALAGQLVQSTTNGLMHEGDPVLAI